MKHERFSRKQDDRAMIARENVEIAMKSAWRNDDRVDVRNSRIKKLVEKSKKLCHWNSHHIKVKDGKKIIVETKNICMCPGNDFKNCLDMKDCFGRSFFEFEENSQE